MSRRDGRRHPLRRLVAGIPEHHPLVAGSPRIDPHGNLGRLAIDGREHGAGVAIDTVLGPVIPDVQNRLPDELWHVYVGVRRHLAGDQRHAGCDERLAGNPRLGVIGKDTVEHRVGDLVCDLVGMPLGNGFGREKAGTQASVELSPKRSDGSAISVCWPEGSAMGIMGKVGWPANGVDQRCLHALRSGGVECFGGGPTHVFDPELPDQLLDFGAKRAMPLRERGYPGPGGAPRPGDEPPTRRTR